MPTFEEALSTINEGMRHLFSACERTMREHAGRFLANERNRQEEILTLNEVLHRYGGRKQDFASAIKSGELKALKVPVGTKGKFVFRIKAADAEAWNASRIAKAQKHAENIPGRGASFFSDPETTTDAAKPPVSGSSWNQSSKYAGPGR